MIELAHRCSDNGGPPALYISDHGGLGFLAKNITQNHTSLAPLAILVRYNQAHAKVPSVRPGTHRILWTREHVTP